MMASEQSSITSTSTPKSLGPRPTPRSTTSTGRKTSNVNPTVSTPAPVLTDAVQKCVDTAAETTATHREAKLVFMQGIVKRILREAYGEPTTPPSVGTSLAQSVFAGVPPPSRGPPPYFMTQPNYHNGQFHQYYPPENPIPISQSPTTSATTTSAGMNTTQTSVTSTTSLTTSTPSATTVHCSSHAAVSREAHRNHTVFTPIDLVESLTKTNHLLVADMKDELQSMNNQLSTQSTENLKTRMEALEQGFIELREVIMQRTINNLKPNPELFEVWDSNIFIRKVIQQREALFQLNQEP